MARQNNAKPNAAKTLSHSISIECTGKGVAKPRHNSPKTGGER